jgi:hypothetical protein
VIAEALTHAGIPYEYEKALTLGGSTRYPDFTIDDDISGRTVYWEHLSLLDREDYRKSWEKKLAWYQSNGVRRPGEPEQAGGLLVVTTESANTGLDMAQVKKVITDVLGG